MSMTYVCVMGRADMFFANGTHYGNKTEFLLIGK